LPAVFAAKTERLSVTLGIQRGCFVHRHSATCLCTFLCEDRPSGPRRPPRTKKADVIEHPKVFDHVGLLVNEPPGSAELLSI
jgi:hypothetical protein